MRVLALDSSTWWGGLALLEQRRPAEPPVVVGELGLRVRASHAPSLMHSIEGLLAIVGWPRSSLDGYIATRGPGSFTGIRVGLGTVRGLSLATDRPCTAVGTLDAVAEAHGPAHVDRLALLAAGRGELFGARFDAASSPAVALEQPWLDTARRVIESRAAGDLLAIPASGSEAALHEAGLAEQAIPISAAPRSIAAAAGRLALLRGLFRSEHGESVSPLYLRPSDAELKARPG